MSRPTDAEVYARHPDLQMADAAAKAHAAQVEAQEVKSRSRSGADDEPCGLDAAIAAHYRDDQS